MRKNTDNKYQLPLTVLEGCHLRPHCAAVGSIRGANIKTGSVRSTKYTGKVKSGPPKHMGRVQSGQPNA
jgi:hypothetical protein